MLNSNAKMNAERLHRRQPHGQRNRAFYAPFSRRIKQDPCLLAGLQLSFGGNDFSLRQSAAPRTAQARAHQEPPPRALGLRSRAISNLGSSEPADSQIRFECPLRL